MNLVTLHRQYFGRGPSADAAAEMDAYSAMPEATVRTAFERAKKHAEYPSWAYVRTILDRAVDDALTRAGAPERKSALCDCCGKPFDFAWMVPEGRYAICKGCIDGVRAFSAKHPDHAAVAAGWIPEEPTSSAKLVRAHFGLEA